MSKYLLVGLGAALVDFDIRFEVDVLGVDVDAEVFELEPHNGTAFLGDVDALESLVLVVHELGQVPKEHSKAKVILEVSSSVLSNLLSCLESLLDFTPV